MMRQDLMYLKTKRAFTIQSSAPHAIGIIQSWLVWVTKISKKIERRGGGDTTKRSHGIIRCANDTFHYLDWCHRRTPKLHSSVNNGGSGWGGGGGGV